MAVLDKLRDFWGILPAGKSPRERFESSPAPQIVKVEQPAAVYNLHPLTLAQLDELWHLDKRCFVNGEAYSRNTLEFLLGEPNNLSYRAVLPHSGAMTGFIITMLEPDRTGHITTIGVAPEHRRRGLAQRLLNKAEYAFRQRGVSLMKLEVRTVNTGAQELYKRAGYIVAQRLVKYYANGGDGLLMIKSLI